MPSHRSAPSDPKILLSQFSPPLEDQPSHRRPPPTLNNHQLHHLRRLGHHIDPVIIVGKDGLTDGLRAALDEALDQHELLKAKLSENAPGDRHDLAAALADLCGAALVQMLGRTVLLYRRRPDSDPRPHISLG